METDDPTQYLENSLLFFVSGMGFYFAMRKRNWKQLMLERTKRILLPFLFGICGHNPIAYVCFSKTLQHALNLFPTSRALMVLTEYFHLCFATYASFYHFKAKRNGKLGKVWVLLMRYPMGPLSVSLFLFLRHC